MNRRTFIGSCALGTVAATVARSQSRPSSAGARAISALISARRLETQANIDQLRRVYHSDAIRVEPGTLKPSVGRAEIVENIRKSAQERRLLYFYYRQPQVLEVGNLALVVSNYEAGYDDGGKAVEDGGKVTSVVMLGPSQPLITQEAIVPNIYAGGYGALGTALTPPRFGMFPLRALGPNPVEASNAGGGENDILFQQVRQINNSWLSGNTNEVLKYANRTGVFLVGDYSPYYITGNDDVKQHFADFYRTSKVNSVRALDPIVRIWGNVAAVAFNFDLDYTINGKTRRSPGRGLYTFARRGALNLPWGMAACAASHLVLRNIGDPYPLER